jgi:hypothetical protein
LLVENHWENGEPAEWLENVDLERYSKEEEELNVQEDEPTDELDDQDDKPMDESDEYK